MMMDRLFIEVDHYEILALIKHHLDAERRLRESGDTAGAQEHVMRVQALRRIKNKSKRAD